MLGCRQSHSEEGSSPSNHLHRRSAGRSGGTLQTEPVPGHQHPRAAGWTDTPARGESGGDF